METYVLPVFLGGGLAASCGLRTFLPLLMLSVAARFHLFGVELNGAVQWLGSLTALIALAIATAVEVTADKVPLIDHALGLVGTVTRPIAGVLAAGAVLSHLDPTTAAIVGLVLGAPVALGVHAAQVSARGVSTVTTAGLGNPVLSLTEEIAVVANTLLAMVLPILVPVLLLAAAGAGYLTLTRLRSRRAPVSDKRSG